MNLSSGTGPGENELRGVPACVFVVFLSAMAPLALIVWLSRGLSIVGGGLIFCCLLILAVPLIAPDVFRLGSEHRGRRIGQLAVWIALSLAASCQVARLGTFMLDVGRTENALKARPRAVTELPDDRSFLARHNCFTCYIIGAHLASEGTPNIYLRELYRDAKEKTFIHEEIGETLTIDTYQYPPPFLLLPRAVLSAAGSFFQARTDWFVLNLLAFCAATGALVVWIGGRRFHVYWLAWPIVLAAPVTLGTLQIGNFHFLIVSLAVLGMVLLETRRYALGGSLLGFAIVSKLFPGVLLAYLLVRGKYRAVIWTTTCMIALCILTLIVFGPQPFEAFVDYQLPQLISGEAFSFARENTRALAINASMMGVAYKLNLMNRLGQLNPETVATIVSWMYSAFLLIAIVIAGRRHRRREGADGNVARIALARCWLALLILGQLRSPFLPWGYGNVMILWLLALMIPEDRRWFVGLTVLAPIWFYFSIPVPLPVGPATISADLVYTIGGTMMALVLGFGVALSRRRPEAATV